MPENVEVKARVADMGALRARVGARAGAAPQVLEQRDTFFHTPRGRLKLREESGARAELIHYVRPDREGPKLCAYSRVASDDPERLRALLADALGVRGVVEKRREVFHVEDTRVHLDEVRGLGAFLELEVPIGSERSVADGERIARELLAALGIDPASLVAEAYLELLTSTEDEPAVDEAALRRALAGGGFPVAGPLPAVSWFGDDPAMARELGELVRAGVKTATAGLLWAWQARDGAPPAPGQRQVIVDWSGRPLAVIEMTEVTVIPFERVGADFARDEGEGDRSLAHWREVHWRFFARECQRIGREPSPSMPVVCMRFRLLHAFPQRGTEGTKGR